MQIYNFDFLIIGIWWNIFSISIDIMHILIDWRQNICRNYTATYMSPKACLSNKDMLSCYHHGIIVDTVKVTSPAHWTPDELDAELQKHCSHLWKNLIEIRLHIFPDPVAAVDAGWKGWKKTLLWDFARNSRRREDWPNVLAWMLRCLFQGILLSGSRLQR